jgi:hypothetical protein
MSDIIPKFGTMRKANNKYLRCYLNIVKNIEQAEKLRSSDTCETLDNAVIWIDQQVVVRRFVQVFE